MSAIALIGGVRFFCKRPLWKDSAASDLTPEIKIRSIPSQIRRQYETSEGHLDRSAFARQLLVRKRVDGHSADLPGKIQLNADLVNLILLLFQPVDMFLFFLEDAFE